MKKCFKKAWLGAIILLLAISVHAQKGYKYQQVPADPLHARIYTLDNGLTVYLTVYKDAPRIQTAIAVRTGSKNDPHDNTGLSHYLEHMMFKGTEDYGTMDYAMEKPLLDQIEGLFEKYRSTTDTAVRRAIYHQIDSISNLASKYAIANEYDKLMSVIGAKGTNAFTGFEETVYIEDIPSNKIQPWIDVEYDRFKEPVFRLFHTELETVYEEKNMSMDNDNDKVFDSLFAGLFPNNTYGTQSTIGTVAHLKNPSLKSLKEYYNSRYVPNNMAILMSGDFNPDEVIAMIDKTFGTLPKKPVTSYTPQPEKPITQPVVKEVVGPDAESVTIGFRAAGVRTSDADYMKLMSQILSNGTAGLIDLNLNQAQKVLEAGAENFTLTEFSVEFFYGKAKQGQSLEEVRDLILGQIDLVKKGQFPDWMIPAIINNMKLQNIKSLQTNQGRVFSMLDGFIQRVPRQEQVEEIDRMSKITKENLVSFANRVFTNNDYVIVYKRTGTAPEHEKVVKPQITPVTMNRDAESKFLKKIMDEPTPAIEPVFIDFNKDITKFSIKQDIPVLYVNNSEDGTFQLTYYFNMGTNANKALGTALDYLQYLGTTKYSPAEIQQEFYKLACSFNVSSSTDDARVSLSGLTENMDQGLNLLEGLMSDAQPNPEAWQNMISDILKKRSDDKLDKGTILWSAMYDYGVYGEKSPFKNILSESELKAMKPEELVGMIHSLDGYQHRVLYYGPMTPADLTTALNKDHNVPATLKPVLPNTKFTEQDNPATKVFTVDYDMKQTEIVMLSKSVSYDAKLTPTIRLFNEYFGGSMNSVVFQEIRESKGLAYSAYGGFRGPTQPWQHYYVFSYIGTQVDKLPEAMKTMLGIFNNMPESDKALAASKDAIINKIRTERITKGNILNTYIQAERFGLNYDIRKIVYEQVPGMGIADLKAFQQKYIKDKNYNILVLGKKDQLDMKTLESYGKVTPLTLETVFGY